ncbi:hypothetical protein [Methylobacterium nonmethylotrophicum]|uniref:Uncharacterized protein n=1 Tax=Methylobacterium nonmethylotrophicum TaxID=1141884 RepID=A0A4Z0NJI3_9HYPH|nr:hypothetical protein [Methylobacterium nonmethylotrophicum]TGD95862.1 hypothetical protein EU555_26015 [Methylobacterium nonmethylotrophicum]
MTVIVGALCSDGIVIGADSMSTSGNGRSPLIQVRSDDKIRVIGGKVIVVGTGSIGLAQRFEAIVEQSWREEVFERGCQECGTSIAALARHEFTTSGVHFSPGAGLDFGAMVAAPIRDAPELIEFNTFDLQPERKTRRRHWVAMGAGQTLADPFLAFVSRVLWDGREPTVAAATVGLCWAIEHAIHYAPGGVGPPVRLAVLRREAGEWRATLLEDDALQEPRQHIAEIEKRIGFYASDGLAAAPPPPPPPPPKPAVSESD